MDVKGKWIKVHGYITAGGDPVYKCSNCGCSEHVYGVEHPNKQSKCKACGSINTYPWETEEDEGKNENYTNVEKKHADYDFWL